MTRLHLVRHGIPLVSDRPRREWSLDPQHVSAVEHLRASGCLPTDASWFTSPERRAIETAGRLGVPDATVVDGLREQERPDVHVDDIHVLVRRAVTSPDVPVASGWESAATTQRRVAEAVAGIMSNANRHMVLVGHGTAWTLLVAHLTAGPPDLESWRIMQFPDRCSIEDGHVVSGWSEWNGAK